MIDELEERIRKVTGVTDMLEEGMLPEDILENLIGSFGLEITEKHEVSFACSCSKEKIERALISIGPKDIREMIQEGRPVDVSCQFCAKQYRFDMDDLRRILAVQEKRA